MFKDMPTDPKEDNYLSTYSLNCSIFNQIIQKFSWLVGWLVFYGISTFVSYLMPNALLYK